MVKVETILAQYETKTLKAKLLEFPAVIRAAKTEVWEMKQVLKSAELIRAAVESDLALEIAAEVNGDNLKPKYSNAESRAAELARRKIASPQYSEANDACRAADRAVNEAQFDLELLMDEFKSYRYIVDLTANELALLAREETEKEPF